MLATAPALGAAGVVWRAGAGALLRPAARASRPFATATAAAAAAAAWPAARLPARPRLAIASPVMPARRHLWGLGAFRAVPVAPPPPPPPPPLLPSATSEPVGPAGAAAPALEPGAAEALPAADPSLASLLAQSEATQAVERAVDAVPPLLATTAPEAWTSAVQLGDFAKLGLCHWTPSGACEKLFEIVYVTTGLPWWGVIAVTTFLLRLAVLPFIVRGQRMAAKMQAAKPITDPIVAAMKDARASGDQRAAQQKAKELQATFKAHGLSPFGAMVSLVQLPVFIGLFFAIRDMCQIPVPGLATGGTAWFTDLTLADPTYVLPVVASSTMWLVMELNAENSPTDQMRSTAMKNLMRGGLLLSLFVTYHFPAGVFVYWVTANAFSLLQTWVLHVPSVRRMLEIPPAPPGLPLGRGDYKLSLYSALRSLRAGRQASRTAALDRVAEQLKRS